MFLPACITALLLMFSVHGIEVVARVHFSQSVYTVKESSEICVDVINETPAREPFRVNYIFSTTLTGSNDIIAMTRQDMLTFPENSSREILCILHEVDEDSCEQEITGTIRLDGNLAVEVTAPRSTTVIIQDDDFVKVSFQEPYYEVEEGSSINDAPVVNTTDYSSDVMIEVTIAPSNTGISIIEPSLIYSTPILLTLNEIMKHVPLDLTDDNIALEDAEPATLSLRVSPRSPCSTVTLGPLDKTTVLIHDDDIVTAKLTKRTGTMKEGESHEVCVTLSKPIARKLNFTLHIRSGTAKLDDLEEYTMETIAVTFLPHSEVRKCITITSVEDYVTEDDETFIIELKLKTTLPAGLRHNLQLGNNMSTITIQDTSLCTNYTLNPANTSSVIYVYQKRTLCFSCSTCSSEMAWSLTSHRDHIWEGTSGNILRSNGLIPDKGKVLPDGTLVLLNSSVVFSELKSGTLRFRDLQAHQPMSSEYEVYIGEKAKVTDLRYTQTESGTRLTCRFTGVPEPEVDWLSDSQPIANEDAIIEQIDTEGESVLLIDSSIAKDSNMMTYTCRVSNMFGFDTSNRDITPGVGSSPINGAISLHYPSYLFLVSLLLSQLL